MVMRSGEVVAKALADAGWKSSIQASADTGDDCPDRDRGERRSDRRQYPFRITYDLFPEILKLLHQYKAEDIHFIAGGLSGRGCWSFKEMA